MAPGTPEVAGGDTTAPAFLTRLARYVADSVFGRSGKLRAQFVKPRAMQIPVLATLFRDSTQSRAPQWGHRVVAVGAGSVVREGGRGSGNVIRVAAVTEEPMPSRTVALFPMRPFADKDGAMVNGYHVGYWPAERRSVRSEAYENPEGFIEVTPENQNTWVSEHFRLRDFITHDQANVWPKYLVLQEELLDKLELVIADLKARGIPVTSVKVTSGFRSPQYNLGLGDGSGRARDSRHQFGDAADIIVDNGTGRMADLNGDRRVDKRDVDVILAAVERVEAVYPELVGGVGLYHATGSHGPFAHIDVRGERARWTTFTTVKKRRTQGRLSCGSSKRRCSGAAARAGRASKAGKSASAKRAAPARVSKVKPTAKRRSSQRTVAKSSGAKARAKASKSARKRPAAGANARQTNTSKRRVG